MTSISQPDRCNSAWLAAGLAAPWAICAWLLHTSWSFDLEHYFGFAVFPAAAYLLWLRWQDQPETHAPPAPAHFLWSIVTAAGVLVLAATIPFLLASPLWPLAAWFACGGAVACSWGLLGAAGGGQLVRRLWFPFVFALTALPWPSVLQAGVVQALRQFHASIAAEIVSALGAPAIAHGTVIETPAGWVGVADACSGIAGLQTAVMLSCFLGVLARLPGVRLVALVLSASAVAILANLVRATTLTWLVASRGNAALESAHFNAASIELCAVMLAVVLLSFCFNPGPEPQRRAPAVLRSVRTRSLALLAALVAAVTLGEAWFRVRPPSRPAPVAWSLSPPDAAWQPATLPEGTKARLGYGSARAIVRSDPEGHREWIVLHLGWGGDPALRYAPGLHSPEICLPGAGARLEGTFGPVTIEIDGILVPFRAARFVAGGKSFHTFSCLWDDAAARPVDIEGQAAVDLLASRLQAVRERRRGEPLEQLTLAVNACRDDREAIALVRQMAPRLFHRR